MSDMAADIADSEPNRHKIVEFNAYGVFEVMSGTCRKIADISGDISAIKYRPKFRNIGFTLTC